MLNQDDPNRFTTVAMAVVDDPANRGDELWTPVAFSMTEKDGRYVMESYGTDGIKGEHPAVQGYNVLNDRQIAALLAVSTVKEAMASTMNELKTTIARQGAEHRVQGTDAVERIKMIDRLLEQDQFDVVFGEVAKVIVRSNECWPELEQDVEKLLGYMVQNSDAISTGHAPAKGIRLQAYGMAHVSEAIEHAMAGVIELGKEVGKAIKGPLDLTMTTHIRLMSASTTRARASIIRKMDEVVQGLPDKLNQALSGGETA